MFDAVVVRQNAVNHLAVQALSARSLLPVQFGQLLPGGGSQSDAAMQITADIFGLPTARPHVYEASGLGAAIDAAVGVGLHHNFSAAVALMTHRGDTFTPNPEACEIYEGLYQRVYRRMYDRLRPLYEEMREITRRKS